MLSGKSAKDGRSVGSGTPKAQSSSPMSNKGGVFRPFSYFETNNNKEQRDESPLDETKGPTSPDVHALPSGKYKTKDKSFSTAKKKPISPQPLIINSTPIEFEESNDLDRVNHFNIHDYIASANNSVKAKPRRVSLGKQKGGQPDNPSRVPKLPSLSIGFPEEETTPKGASVKPALQGVKANHDRSLT